MRPSRLSLAVALVAMLASPVPHPAAGGEDRSQSRADRPVRLPGPSGPADQAGPNAVPYAQVATDLDLAVVVPELQAAFGERYGGYWLEIGRRSDTMHVGVVGATRQDAATVARLTDHHRRVTTEAVTHGYDALLAAQEEIARSLDTGTDFAVGVDVAANEVVVQTESRDVRATASVAQTAARRGGARAHRQAGGQAPARDLGGAVRVRAATPITVATAGPAGPSAPTNANRNVFPPYESGLRALIAISSTGRAVCTSGFVLRNGFGWFGTVAGHCGAPGRRVAFGNVWADYVRANGYTSTSRVGADVALVSLSIRRWPSRAAVHASTGHVGLVGKLPNAVIAPGLKLCFEGVTSDSGNCGPVNLTRQWVCCDATRRQFYYSCIAYPTRPGDSGGPVYQLRSGARAYAAGMVSSSVTIGGRSSTCFSLIESIEKAMASRMYLL